MTLTFSYLRKGNQLFPIVDARLKGPKASIVVKALVDSGATYSLFREEIAEYLGIKIEGGKPLYLEGIGGRILGYLHTIPIAIGQKGFLGKVVLSREFRVSINIMGRDNFFEPFWITFKEKAKVLEFIIPE